MKLTVVLRMTLLSYAPCLMSLVFCSKINQTRRSNAPELLGNVYIS